MWILQSDNSYLNSEDNKWKVIRKDNKWLLYYGNEIKGIFDTLEQAIGKGPA